MNSIRYILAAAILASTGLAKAELAIGGIGVTTCDVWLDARKEPQEDRSAIIESLVSAWVQGYLSSKNVENSSLKMVLSVPSSSVINTVLDLECATARDSKIYPIAEALAKNLRALYQRK
jgi:hypothetical protein